jgi:hypothetical protein
MNRIRRVDWDAAAGVIAAVAALVLHLLHVVDADVLLSIILVLLALMLVRDLRREDREAHTAETAERTAAGLIHLQRTLSPPDSLLIGPQQLRAESERFARGARGDMIWFNVCLLMFAPQSLFDALLRPAVENPRVTSIQFVLDERERERWQSLVLPKVAQCAVKDKVWEPHWTELAESVSFILAEQDSSGSLEAHLSFWGEPFMARTPGRDVPRYIFHVQAHSELIVRLVELQRQYRLGGRT